MMVKLVYCNRSLDERLRAQMMRYGRNAAVLYQKAWNSTLSSQVLQEPVLPVDEPYTTQIKQPTPLQHFRCYDSNPIDHKLQHLNRFYTVLPETYRKLFTHGGMTREFHKMVKTFNECCVMVRKPALEVMSYLQTANYSTPVIRYLLYGRVGAGKTMTLAHLIHYASIDGWLIVHAPWVPLWTRVFKEIIPSQSHPGRMDHHTEAVAWLQQFKQQNAELIQAQKLTISKTYTWSKREATEEGSPLSSVYDHGINRVKFASDCVAVILKEIKLLANAGRTKAFVAVDGMNALYQPTRIRREDKSPVGPNDVTLVRAFQKLMRNDWTNGAVVCVVDKLASHPDLRESYHPRYLLGKQGFEDLDPFIPVITENYSLKEIHSCLDYYTDRRWIQVDKGRTEEGRKELIFLSGNNPDELCKICAAW